MKERPILFSAPMVRAILDGRKCQTRRVVTPQSNRTFYCWSRPGVALFASEDEAIAGDEGDEIRCPYGAPGDRLWVRESLKRGLMMSPLGTATNANVCFYAADNAEVLIGTGEFNAGWEWQRDTLPSIHMPRWASRITLEITDVRMQRLQEISEDDARAEGVTGDAFCNHRITFSALWDSINHTRAPWASNPWVWALTFRRLA